MMHSNIPCVNVQSGVTGLFGKMQTDTPDSLTHDLKFARGMGVFLFVHEFPDFEIVVTDFFVSAFGTGFH